MKFRDKEYDLDRAKKSVFCVGLGTGLGLIVYAFFWHYNIAIFGWNLGLLFAPLVAGYVETIVANRLLGKNLGAISAFILFFDTTIYSFILKNPSLGMNFITAGTLVVIFQAAFPTAINYLIMVVTGSTLANFKWIVKSIKKIFKPSSQKASPSQGYVELKNFDENASNEKINSLDFYFLTSNDMGDIKHENLGMFNSQIIIKNDDKIGTHREEIEHNRLVEVKQAKDECLIKLAEQIKENGGNGILDLELSIGIVGLGGDHLHITASGMGINLNKN